VLSVLSVTFPFFALLLIGFAAARTRVLPLEAVPGLNSFVLYFALTALLFQLGARTPVAELLDPVVLGIWLLAGLIVMGLAAATARRRGVGWLDSSFGALIAALPNSGFMGVPLLVALMGDVANGPIIAALLIDVIVIQSLAVAFSHRGHGDPHGALGELLNALKRMAKNPLPWAIVLGGVWGGLGWSLPGPVDTTIMMLAQAASPVALFTIGAVLAREQMLPGSELGPGGLRSWRDVPWLAALKLLAHPLLVWGIGLGAIAAGLPIDHPALVVLVLTAALPSAANAAVLAERFGANTGRITRVILMSTVVSFGTFTAAVALLH
jgi:malonate transporter